MFLSLQVRSVAPADQGHSSARSNGRSTRCQGAPRQPLSEVPVRALEAWTKQMAKRRFVQKQPRMLEQRSIDRLQLLALERRQTDSPLRRRGSPLWEHTASRGARVDSFEAKEESQHGAASLRAPVIINMALASRSAFPPKVMRVDEAPEPPRGLRLQHHFLAASVSSSEASEPTETPPLGAHAHSSRLDFDGMPPEVCRIFRQQRFLGSL